ncbi:MAG: CvpA family protein [Terracidiphilus sp.]|jgi:membrane protein required for colicin V production
MAWIDWVIVFIMAASMIGGMSQGFFRSACGLAGLLIGLAVASWNYGRLAKIVLPLVRLHAVADTIGFLLIALLVMVLFAILGAILAKAFRLIGLGCLDSLAGAIFGFFQGVILVTLGILALAAFFPDTQWLENARLPKLFFGACHLSTHISPGELAHRVRDGLKILEHDTHELVNPKPMGS